MTFNDLFNAHSEEEKFPTIDDNASLYLSVIIPAYNEEFRLPKMLDECIPYLNERQKKNPYAFGFDSQYIVTLPMKLLLWTMAVETEQKRLVGIIVRSTTTQTFAFLLNIIIVEKEVQFEWYGKIFR